MVSGLVRLLNPETMLQALLVFGPTVALFAVFFIVFAESGLFFGFFLPGDSLLFTAGFFASIGYFPFWLLLVLAVAGAILGDTVGYFFGKMVGRKIFEKEDSRFFKKKHLTAAHEFYERHGGKAIILARFMPFVRTFAPIVAGSANMSYGKFLSYNVIGGVLWGAGVSTAGFLLGSLIPRDQVDKYLFPIIGVIIIISLSPILIHALSGRNANRKS